MRHWIREDRSQDLGKETDNKNKEYELSGVSYERDSWAEGGRILVGEELARRDGEMG